MATTASLPMRESTETLIAPFWRYRTSLAAIALCEDDLLPVDTSQLFVRRACRFEIRLHIERAPILRFRGSFGFHDRATIISRRTDPASGVGTDQAVQYLTVSMPTRCHSHPASPHQSPARTKESAVWTNPKVPLAGRAIRRTVASSRKPSPESAASTRSRAAGCRRAGRRSSAAGRDPARRCWP